MPMSLMFTRDSGNEKRISYTYIEYSKYSIRSNSPSMHN